MHMWDKWVRTRVRGIVRVRVRVRALGKD